MLRKNISIAGILCLVILFSYFTSPPQSPDSKFSAYFKSSFSRFISDLKAFDLALGITGFDSPVSLNSLNEAISSLQAVDEVLGFYADDPLLRGKSFYPEEHKLITAGILYLRKNNQFNSFNRMFFIRSFLNPLAVLIGNERRALLQTDNPFHYSLIEKKTQLFAESSFRKDSYLFDDTITPARVMLGIKLFNEPLLSSNGKRSCAFCHRLEKAFTDKREKALEVDGHTILTRNTPTLLNAAFQHNLFSDSRQHSLDQLINEVLSNAKEMNTGPDSSVVKLRGDQAYEDLYAAASTTATRPSIS